MLAALAQGGCVYPRRSTSLTLARGDTESISAPPHVWQLRIVSGILPPRQRSGLSWDEGEGLPDPFVRLYRNDQLVFESRAIDDTITPEWDELLPKNFWAAPGQAIRAEIWDQDGLTADPVGTWRYDGLPNSALPGADARIGMEGGATLTIRVSAAQTHRGTGIEEYEVRSDELIVLAVTQRSPAGRAGLRVGDRITAIGEQSVRALGEAGAASALSMAAERRQPLTISRDGATQQIELDGVFVWQVM